MDLFAQLREFFHAGYDLFGAFNHYVATRFGTEFQVAINWVLLGLLLVLLVRVFKFSFDVLRYVLVPSLVLSGIVAGLSSLSFMYVLPMAMGLGTVLMLFRS